MKIRWHAWRRLIWCCVPQSRRSPFKKEQSILRTIIPNSCASWTRLLPHCPAKALFVYSVFVASLASGLSSGGTFHLNPLSLASAERTSINYCLLGLFQCHTQRDSQIQHWYPCDRVRHSRLQQCPVETNRLANRSHNSNLLLGHMDELHLPLRVD